MEYHITNSQTILSYKSKTNGDLVTLFSYADAGVHIENDLLLNAAKTEALVVGIRPQIAKQNLSGDIVVSGSTVSFDKKLPVPGVTLDN